MLGVVNGNQKFSEVTGYDREECLGRNPRMLKSGESPPSVYRELWSRITAGKTWRGKFHNRRKDGELYWERAIISPLVDVGGRLTHWLNRNLWCRSWVEGKV